jgi:hypothetical protein
VPNFLPDSNVMELAGDYTREFSLAASFCAAWRNYETPGKPGPSQKRTIILGAPRLNGLSPDVTGQGITPRSW